MRNLVLVQVTLINTLLACNACFGQTLKTRSPGERDQTENRRQATVPVLVTVPMRVPVGTPIKVVVDSELRIRKVGQPIQARTVEPIYSFDKLLIPSGTAVLGKVSSIDDVSKKSRVMQAMDGNFSPQRPFHVQFEELVMPDGRRILLHTVSSPAPNGVLSFVPAKLSGEPTVGGAASKKISQAKAQVHQQWADLQKQIHQAGKLHKLKRLAVAQLPVRPQYIEAGTSFNVNLLQSLDFGTESVKPEALSEIGTAPPSGSVVHARLVTPLSSATSKKGEKVEALITEPLVISDHLILPEGSVISGSVMQVHPARRLARSGNLRILFHEVAPPNGLAQKVQTSLEGVAVAKGEHLKLDSEGGAAVATPKTRYLTTGIQVVLAATTTADGGGEAHGGGGGGDLGGSAANGASGFRLVGALIGMAARSRIVASGFGAYGAANAIYNHFLARGRDVVYPKDMAMVIGLGVRDSKPSSSTAPAVKDLEDE